MYEFEDLCIEFRRKLALVPDSPSGKSWSIYRVTKEDELVFLASAESVDAVVELVKELLRKKG